MQVHSFAYDLDSKNWSVPTLPPADSPRTLVLAFGAPEVRAQQECFAQLSKMYPRSTIIGCSSAGEIHGTEVKDRSLSVTVTKFDRTDILLASVDVTASRESFTAGQALARKLGAKPGLRGVLILSEGLGVNGSELVRGVNSVVDSSVVVTGGLSGDGPRFKQTWVAVGAKLKSNLIVAVGFYGDYVQIGHGSKGGWDKFGPERLVTRAEGNVVYELDNKPALLLYKEYLGERAKDLPASGLSFPLAIRTSRDDDKYLIRTILGIDPEKNSLTFAGDIPTGALAQLMKADFDRLIGGASLACAMAKENGTPVGKSSLVIAISCVGRRLVLDERTEEEVEAIVTALPKAHQSHITGFYSYGEISPYASGHCDLHNQTMTLTVFSESQTPLPKLAGRAQTSTARSPSAAAPPLPKRSPIEELDLDLEISTDTRRLSAASLGFGVASLSYDLLTKSWSTSSFPDLDSPRTLVLAFGAPEAIEQPEAFTQLARAYPESVVIGCSSSGEIHGSSVKDQSISVTVSRFEKTDLSMTSIEVSSQSESYVTGQTLARRLSGRAGLRGLLILSEGLGVNGSELVRGINSVVDESVVVTGGLAGDGPRFKRTWVLTGSKIQSNVVTAVGFYGDYVQIGHGSKGGWDKFGPERVVTRSEGNVVYELDGKPALQLYKEYLGAKASELPASGLSFPLAVRASRDEEKFLIRTILAIDPEKNSLTFAGDIPTGYIAQLMKADFERLIGGATLATGMVNENGHPVGPASLVVAISCVGRRLVLGERTEDEVEAIVEALPKAEQAHITGFYSYGEISPYASGHCDLHNQTMTLTVFSESQTPLPRKTGKGPSVRRTSLAPIRAEAPSHAHVSASVVASPAASASPIRVSAPPPVRVSAPPVQASAPSPRVEPPAVASETPAMPAARPRHVTRVPLQATGASTATVQKQARAGYTLLTITGKLTESFRGEAIGRELRGTVAIDLGGIERITSFGVREWLSMLGAMQEVRRLYFVRCSEAVVNQLGMIRKFSGNGQIVSFFAPYLCSSCGEPFERSFDCEYDAATIRGGDAPAAPCPHCEGEGRFDDDPRTYFAFASAHTSTPIPNEIRALQNELDAAPLAARSDAVDKSVDGDVTRVRVRAKSASSVRWKRVFEGIEGALVVDLGGVGGFEPIGVANFEQAVSSLGPEVTSIVLERCPATIVNRLALSSKQPRLSVASAALDAYCRSCAVHRVALVSTTEHRDALASGEVPRVNCKRCNQELELRDAQHALAFFRRQLAPSTPPPSLRDVVESRSGMAVPMPRAAEPVSPPRERLSVPPPTPKRVPFTSIAVGALAIAVVGLAGMQFATASKGAEKLVATQPTTVVETATAQRAEPEAPPQTAGSGTPWMQNMDLPPAWVERPIVIEGGSVFVVGKSDAMATPELAIAQARSEAIVRLVRQIHRDMTGSPMHEFVQERFREPDRATNEAIAARYIQQFGATGTPERVDAAFRKRESGVEGFARYQLSKEAYDNVLSSYRSTATIQGMVIGRFFPLLETSLRTDGALVVVSVLRGKPAAEQGVRPGDAVLAVGGRPVTTVESLTKTANDEWTATPPRGVMSVDFESGGAKRTLRFWKAPTPTPQGP